MTSFLVSIHKHHSIYCIRHIYRKYIIYTYLLYLNENPLLPTGTLRFGTQFFCLSSFCPCTLPPRERARRGRDAVATAGGGLLSTRMGVSCSGDGDGLQGGWDIHGRSVSKPCDLKQPRFVGETHIWQIFDLIICLIIWSLIWGLNLYKTYESSFCCIWRIAGKRSQVRQNHPSPGSVGVSHSWVRAAKAYFFCNYKYLNINFALREMMCSVFFRHAFHHFAPKQSFGVPFLPWNHGGNIPKKLLAMFSFFTPNIWMSRRTMHFPKKTSNKNVWIWWNINFHDWLWDGYAL